MELEWDEAKRQTVLRVHKVDFEDAALIFEGPVLLKADDRRDYGESRFIAIGMVGDLYYTVVFTPRGTAMRLITAWRTGKNDRNEYQTHFAGRAQEAQGPGQDIQ